MRQRPQPTRIPYTIERLNSLRQGQEMVYYRGNFERDIAACDPSPGAHGQFREAPGYRALLRSIRSAAKALQESGRVLLIERSHADARRTYTEYVAIGAEAR